MFLFEKQAKRVEKISIASIQITSRRKDTAKNTADTRNITGFYVKTAFFGAIVKSKCAYPYKYRWGGLQRIRN
jgi:hypothetical protein